MPKDPSLRKVLVIGSGPIVIGQAAEFDYAGTQACRAFREEGIEVVLVNSNPATIMTDTIMADEIYIEPLTLDTVKRIIERERPDGVLSTLGGQTGLTLSMQLAKEGFLDKMGVRLLGAKPETIDKAEDRQIFKDTMAKIHQPCIPSRVVNTLEDALAFAEEIGYPLIIRPAFTLGGTGGGIVSNDAEMREIGEHGLRLSPIHQILVERCIAGWKEIEYEAIRDSAGNAITICSMENFDPVGVHTGDSIVVAPAVTLSDKEYQMLRTAALDIVTELGIEGGCNVQFALHPTSMEYAVIEVNPRVSRSSALASKATGYPIAKVAAKLAIGYTLDEIPNAVTGTTYACFEPALDYLVLKMPKWPFDKFVYAKRTLGTQMKATGEVMAIGQSFEEAMMKAVRGAEVGRTTLTHPKFAALSDEALRERLHVCDDERLFAVYEAVKRGIALDFVHDITKIDLWFLAKLRSLSRMEQRIASGPIDAETYRAAKRFGFLDKDIERLSGAPLPCRLTAGFKMVDTCAAEFPAETPYFYSSYDEENEAEQFLAEHSIGKPRVIVFGAGPIRIGQGIEFDYASVHCVRALKKLGYEVVIVNNNPETVSTDFDTADRLYFEPLNPEDVAAIIATEKPVGVVVAFGGQTAIKLTKSLEKMGVPIIGTTGDCIDMAEDRERFDGVLANLGISRPAGHTVMTAEEALKAAEALGYPVLMRPSYVLGGQNMIIAFSDDDIREYMAIILAQNIENPVLIDKYLMGVEVEVDAICDGEDILIPGIMEHIERAGVHSGDSIAVYPAWNVSGALTAQLIDYTRRLSLSLGTKGLVNIQYVIHENKIYVIEVNPRSSRTIPYISKVTGVPMVELAVRCMLGEKLEDMGYGVGLYKEPPYVAVKVPVFSFEKLTDVDVQLGPEMKSTGEVLGIGRTLEEAIYKGLLVAGYRMQRSGGVLITVRDSDKPEIAEIAKQYAELGFKLYATTGTARLLKLAGLEDVISVAKLYEGKNQIYELLESGVVSIIISSSSKGRLPERDSVKMRRKAVELGIPCLTSLDTAAALARSIRSRFTPYTTELVDINHMRKGPQELRFTKMQTGGNDYIYFDCTDIMLLNPGSLAISLSDRHFGIGGDGIVLLTRSDKADCFMHMYNKDGSEGGTSGNALRCVAKLLYEKGMATGDKVRIETRTGIRKLSLYVLNGKVYDATVNMGLPELTPAKVPVRTEGEKVVGQPVVIGGREWEITCCSMGNPHCVVFCKYPDNLNLEEIGPQFEYDPLFPDRVNAEFVHVIDSHTLKMRVWERGNGETSACGTGACAAVVAAVENGFCPMDEDITVRVRGGNLIVRYTKAGVMLSGKPVTVFEGTIRI